MGKVKDFSKLLTEKQLKNLSTGNLNNYRKSFTAKLGYLKYKQDLNTLEPDEHKLYITLSEHYALIKEILAKREHIEKKAS